MDITFNNGIRFPMIGLGTWLSSKEEVKTAVREALHAGYRHIDTAYAYRNEDAIGEVLEDFFRNGELKREEIFITTKGVWFGIIHHTVNKHQWMISYSDYAAIECDHGPLSTQRDKGWLTAATPLHDALIKIVMDKILLKKMPYYVQCRSTAELENFQNVILKYDSKRHSYGPNTYAARNKMAALDHNAHIDREIVRNKDGSERDTTARKVVVGM